MPEIIFAEEYTGLSYKNSHCGKEIHVQIMWWNFSTQW